MYCDITKLANNKIDQLITTLEKPTVSKISLIIGSEYGLSNRFVLKRLEQLKEDNQISINTDTKEITRL